MQSYSLRNSFIKSAWRQYFVTRLSETSSQNFRAAKMKMDIISLTKLRSTQTLSDFSSLISAPRRQFFSSCHRTRREQVYGLRGEGTVTYFIIDYEENVASCEFKRVFISREVIHLLLLNSWQNSRSNWMLTRTIHKIAILNCGRCCQIKGPLEWECWNRGSLLTRSSDSPESTVTNERDLMARIPKIDVTSVQCIIKASSAFHLFLL